MLKFSMAKFHIIITAAGSSSRMGLDRPKQYLAIHKQTFVERVTRVFENISLVDSIHIALHPKDDMWKTLNLSFSPKVNVHYCGGASRGETVLNALEALKGHADELDWILVHDAARPGIQEKDVNHLIDTLKDDPVGGLLAYPITDTIKKSDKEDRVINSPARDHLWQAQTPQMYRYKILSNALKSFDGIPTDESQAIERLGMKPKLIKGDFRNFKVTYQEDLSILEHLISE
ncbi:MAG: 2-C-methyl-D-erythritol 4-phosphate cytidylyltransferase [Candidatus Methylopumilus sp.]|nr:2-C-methyl-D-erythritol 4-phosphate cytidylyltransferase [Candidatus Methylopumilus sp.]